MPDERKWYYSVNKNRQGPMPESDIAGLIKNGVVGPDTYVWTKSIGEWARMGDTDLIDFLDEPESPPPDDGGDEIPPTPEEEPVLSPEDGMPPLDEIEEDVSEPAQPVDDEDIPPLDDVEEGSPANTLAEPPLESPEEGMPPAVTLPEPLMAPPPPPVAVSSPISESKKAVASAEPIEKIMHHEKTPVKFGVLKIAAIFAALLIASISITAFVVYKAGASRARTQNVAARGSTNSSEIETTQEIASIPNSNNAVPSPQSAIQQMEANALLESTPHDPWRSPDIPGIPPDGELARAQVTGENVNIRKSPNMKGDIAYQVSVSDGEYFIVEKSRIIDGNDKSEWYKIVFRCHEDFDEFSYSREPIYVSSRFAKTYPLETYDKNELDWFRQGRPPLINTGDDLSGYEHEELSMMTPFELTRQITLRKFPDGNSDIITLDRGTAILDAFYSADYLPFLHNNMNDEAWMPVIGSDKKLLGWMDLEEYKNLLDVSE